MNNLDDRKDIIEECEIFTDQEGLCYGPCKHVDGKKCAAYMDPKTKWRLGHCPLASHWKEDTSMSKSVKKRIGQQKQQKH